MNKPKLLVIASNQDGFALLHRAKQAARKAGWSRNKIKEFTEKATEDHHKNLLQVCLDNFDCF